MTASRLPGRDQRASLRRISNRRSAVFYIGARKHRSSPQNGPSQMKKGPERPVAYSFTTRERQSRLVAFEHLLRSMRADPPRLRHRGGHVEIADQVQFFLRSLFTFVQGPDWQFPRRVQQRKRPRAKPGPDVKKETSCASLQKTACLDLSRVECIMHQRLHRGR